MNSTFHKKNRKSGQRAHERISIPGATVSWKNAAQTSFPNETLPLSDISRFGVALLTNSPPEVDADISLKISFPKSPEHLELNGNVVYSVYRGPGLTYEYRVGVQLKPYSETEGENSLKSQTVIEELERKYGKKLEAQDIED